jgi:PAS domain S-box-containing protein
MDLDPGEVKGWAVAVTAIVTAMIAGKKFCVGCRKWIVNRFVAGDKIAEVLELLRALSHRVAKLDDVVQVQLKPNGRPICEKVDETHRGYLINNGWRQLDFDHSDIAQYQCNPLGQCVAVNSALCDLFGMSDKQMLVFGWLDAIDGAEERQRVRDNWQDSNEHDTPHSDTYNVENKKTGEKFICSSETLVIKDKRGPIWYVGTVRRK